MSEKINNDSITVFFPWFNSGIGDFVICAGLCPEISKKYGKNVKFLCHSSWRRFGLEYKNTEMVYIDDKDFEREKNKALSLDERDCIYAWFKSNECGKLIRGQDVNFADEFKKYIFDLPLTSVIHKPKLTNHIRLSDDFPLDEKNVKKSIIIAPYSSSSDKLQNELIECGWWTRLCEEIKSEYKCDIYTNINKQDESAIPGTFPISVTGNDLIYLANNCMSFIGVRMGLLDLLAVMECRLICIANMGYFHYDLKCMYPKSNVKSMYMCWKFIKELENNVVIGDREMKILDSLHAKIIYDISPNSLEDGRYFCRNYDELTKVVVEAISER